MNYRDEVVVALGLPALDRLPGDVRCLARRSLTFVRTDGISFVLLFRGLSDEDDRKVTEWLDTLDPDNGETYEVMALGGSLSETEHYSNTLDGNVLTVERVVCCGGREVRDEEDMEK